MRSAWNAYMRFADIECADRTRAHGAKVSRDATLKTCNLKEGKIELLILSNLWKMKLSSVYKLSINLRKHAHYSTILRALRRLEEKGLVELSLFSRKGRRQKVYELTLLGRLIAALAEGGWKTAAQVAAAESPRFKECVQVHRFLDPYYYWGLTKRIISGLRPTKKEDFEKFDEFYRGRYGPAQTKEIYRSWRTRKYEQPNIDDLVVQIEYDNIQEYFLNYFDESSLSDAFNRMKILSRVSWIRSIVMSVIDERVDEDKRWIERYIKFKNDLISAEKNVKLTQFFDTSHHKNSEQ